MKTVIVAFMLLFKITLFEEYEENKLKNEDSYSCFYAFVQDHTSNAYSSTYRHQYHIHMPTVKIFSLKSVQSGHF